MRSKYKTSKEKDGKAFWSILSQKCSALLLVSLAFLFVVWFLENVRSISGVFQKIYDEFVPWLLHLFVEAHFPESLTFPHIIVYVVDITLLILVLRAGYLVKKKFDLYKIFCFVKKVFSRLWRKTEGFLTSESKWKIVCHWFGKHIRTLQTIKKIIIGLSFFSWLGYAFFRSGTLLSIVDDVASILGTKASAMAWAENGAMYSLWYGRLFVILLLIIEFVNFLGWDYLRFGSDSFFKGGKHWYEDEDKYLDEGDYGLGGKFAYKVCIVIDALFDFLRLNRLLRFLKLRTLGEYVYQLYILVRYNSLLYRLAYLLILVFALKNIGHLLMGEIPPWSSWWDSEGWIADFINSSTTLRIFLSSPLDNLSFLVLFGLIVEKAPRNAFLKSFLYERLNGIIVFVSTIVAILLVLANVAQKNLMAGLLFADALFTVVFLIEIALKIYEAGSKFFFKENSENFTFWLKLDWWNITDAVVVLASITSIFMLKDEYQLISGMYAMIILRVVRLLKLVRLLKMFKKYLANLFDGVKHALIKSIPIIIIFGICLTFLGFILYLFSAQEGIGEQYFRDPITSVFSLFQLFTYDGWHQIPTDISIQCQSKWDDIWWIDTAVRIGFCVLVFAGGIVGVALLNSVFVDGMLLRDQSDEDRTRRLNELDRKLEEISTKLDDMEKRRLQG